MVDLKCLMSVNAQFDCSDEVWEQITEEELFLQLHLCFLSKVELQVKTFV